MSQREPGYFGAIVRALKSVTDGLAVTMSYVFRPPITVQYPDRTPVPVPDTLPERYRGLLEVDMEVCGACKACERDCPIGCIRIDMTKEKGADGKPKLIMTRFDIDMSKCMFCGLCVEACGTECQCEGDTETTKAIHFTREFEGVVDHPAQMVYRFIRPGDRVQAAKSVKEVVPARRRGEALRDARRHAQVYNALAFAWALEHEQHKDVAPLGEAEKPAPAAGGK
jgi:NAD(P)H-quinone oxidoreductase subunit I